MMNRLVDSNTTLPQGSKAYLQTRTARLPLYNLIQPYNYTITNYYFFPWLPLLLFICIVQNLNQEYNAHHNYLAS